MSEEEIAMAQAPTAESGLLPLVKAPTERAPTKQEFRDVIGRFASGVTVITTRVDDQDFGSTVSAVSSLTDEPPMLLVCLNKASATGQAVKRSGTFAVNVLAEDHVEVAARFASRIPDKFRGLPVERAHQGSPLLPGSIAHLICTVQEHVVAGTHYAFLARVDAATSSPGHPLAYFRGMFGRMQVAPEAADLARVREWARTTGSDTGQAIDVDVLIRELGLDANAVDRCLRALAGEGMIARSGPAYVLEPIPDPIIFESYAAKLVIELGVAQRTIHTATDEQIAELRRLMETTLDLVDGNSFTDVDGWIEANEAFHEYMVRLAGSAILLDTYHRLGLPGLNRRTLTASSLADPALLEDHKLIVEAYEARDAEALMRALTVHADRPRQIRTREAATSD
jgi:flavin reductase (DIM6/NTAB) family NADH-FMN oxidoreductase RutF/DNA-binding GntR family transcriptional regulator